MNNVSKYPNVHTYKTPYSTHQTFHITYGTPSMNRSRRYMSVQNTPDI